jgi:acetyl/propionyl-CoA carboxylase alpha subunit
MLYALDDYVVLGVKTCIDFLKDVIAHPAFREGRTNTGFIGDFFKGWQGREAEEDLTPMALLAAAYLQDRRPARMGGPAPGERRFSTPWDTMGRWRIGEK